MKQAQLLVILVVMTVLGGLCQSGFAATEAVAGRVVERDGLTLTIEQRDGRKKQVKLRKDTPVVAVPRVTAPLIDRIRPDSRVSIILKNSKPVVVQIVEVPK